MSRRLKRKKLTNDDVGYYYVDATSGNDANRGMTADDAWQTIAKVNGYTFQTGDNILFKRGETWVGVALVPPRDNLSFGAYGAGANPILDGNDLVNCIWINGMNDLTFKDIETTQGIDSGFAVHNSSKITVIDCDAHDCGNDNLIFITDCYDCRVIRGSFYNSYQRVGGTNCSGIEIADGSHDIELVDVTCYDNAGGAGFSGLGITVHSHGATVLPYNIVVDGAECYGNTDYGVFVWKQDNVADTDRNIVVKNCHLHNNNMGIRIRKEAGAANFPDGITIEDCLIENNTAEAFYLHGDNIIVRRNIFRGTGRSVECVNHIFYNNTFYFSVGAGAYPVYFASGRTDHIEFKNNIVNTTVAAAMCIGVDATVVLLNIDIDYNLYHLDAETVANTRWHWLGVAKSWADWLADSGEDGNSPMADQDPLFTNPGAGDFTLQAGSPAIDAGVDVGLPYLGTAPDCGYVERE